MAALTTGQSRAERLRCATPALPGPSRRRAVHPYHWAEHPYVCTPPHSPGASSIVPGHEYFLENFTMGLRNSFSCWPPSLPRLYRNSGSGICALRRKDSQNAKTGGAQVTELIDLTMRMAQKVARVGIASSIPLHGLCKLLRQNSALARSLRTSPRQVMRCIGASCAAMHACCAQPCLPQRKQIHGAIDCGQVRMANISGRGRKHRSSLVVDESHPFG